MGRDDRLQCGAHLRPRTQGRWRGRAISEAQLREVLRAPQAVVPANRPERVVVQGHVTLGDPPQKALLRVVVDVGLDPPEVVTVYATTQFRRYGAKP
jgi:hypothetical protein